jgi:hypothetical protein
VGYTLGHRTQSNHEDWGAKLLSVLVSSILAYGFCIQCWLCLLIGCLLFPLKPAVPLLYLPSAMVCGWQDVMAPLQVAPALSLAIPSSLERQGQHATLKPGPSLEVACQVSSCLILAGACGLCSGTSLNAFSASRRPYSHVCCGTPTEWGCSLGRWLLPGWCISSWCISSCCRVSRCTETPSTLLSGTQRTMGHNCTSPNRLCQRHTSAPCNSHDRLCKQS